MDEGEIIAAAREYGQVGELAWKGAFVDMTVRFMVINGDGLEFNFPIGMAYTVLLVPTAEALKASVCSASHFPHGCERAFVGEAQLDLYLQGISAAMMAFGDHHFPATLQQLKFRHAHRISVADEA